MQRLCWPTSHLHHTLICVECKITKRYEDVQVSFCHVVVCRVHIFWQTNDMPKKTQLSLPYMLDKRLCVGHTLQTVVFSYASRERNHCEQPFDFPSSKCEVRHTPRDVFDITSSYFAGNLYTAGSPKRSSYVAERKRKRQNKFTNSFYRFKFNLFVLGAGRRLTQRN